MTKRLAIASLAAAILVAAGASLVAAQSGGQPQPAPAGLRAASTFTSITDEKARSVALFSEAGKVIQSPRCMNCHPATERPTQTETMRPHIPLVVRGEAGMGAAGGLSCGTCHHDKNFDAAGVPGNPKWQLAPAEMAWQGKSLGQICAQIKDPARNGGRKLDDLVEHMAHDELVGWAWHPGGTRVPAPGTQESFGALIKAWVETGAHCPA